MIELNGRELDIIRQQIRLAEAFVRNCQLDGSPFVADAASPLSAYEQLIVSLLPDARRPWGVLPADGDTYALDESGQIVVRALATDVADVSRQSIHVGLAANENVPETVSPPSITPLFETQKYCESSLLVSSLNNFSAGVWTNSIRPSMLNDGAILVGGIGSDTMQGSSENDMFDGDAWLRVRINIVTRLPGEEAVPFEDIPNDEAHVVKTINSLTEVHADLLAGVIDPGQLRIVREIISSAGSEGADVVLSQAIPNILTIEGTVQGTAPPEASGDGFVNVQNAAGPLPQALRPANDDGSDLLLNIERVRIINESNGSARDASGDFSFTPGRPGYSRLNSALPFILAVAALTDPDALDLNVAFFWDTAGSQRGQWEQEATGEQHAEPVLAADDHVRGAALWAPVSLDSGVAAIGEAVAVHVESGNGTQTDDGVSGLDLLDLAESLTETSDDDEGRTSHGALSLASETAADAGTVAANASASLEVMVGTSGADVISMAHSATGVQLLGGAGDDVLYGSMWDDDIYGSEGDDVIDGLAGNDRMSGGTGNDIYYIDSADDVIIEADGAQDGTRDVARIAIDRYALAANVEVGVLDLRTGGSLVGNAGNNILLGGAGNDSIDGGAGADFIVGGAGRDQLSGGDGDDTIVYDAADDLANVMGGSGRDILAVTGDAPVDFDLVAQGFEEALVNRSDTDGTENWTAIQENYIGDWQLASQRGLLDDGGTWILQMELSGAELHDYVIDYFSSAGEQTGNLVHQRDGSTIETVIDVSDVEAYQFYIDYRDAALRQTGLYILNDDETSNDTNFDAANEFDWRLVSNTADNSGRITTMKTVFDDDSMVSVRYDASADGNAQEWTAVTEYINAAGELTREFTTYDNGNVRDVYFDLADAEPWNYQAFVYDPDGQQIHHYFG